jgi:hypothetical protein
MFGRYSERARHVIFLALWSATKRGASYIEPEDLLHAVIQGDIGEFALLSGKAFGASSPIQDKTVPRRFFAEHAAEDLLCELGHPPESASTATLSGKIEPVPHSDMPVSHDLENILGLVARKETKTIQPCWPRSRRTATVGWLNCSTITASRARPFRTRSIRREIESAAHEYIKDGTT